MEEMENAYRDRGDEREGKGPLERFKSRWGGNIKLNLMV
jgi:hypothetical protein